MTGRLCSHGVSTASAIVNTSIRVKKRPIAVCGVYGGTGAIGRCGLLARCGRWMASKELKSAMRLILQGRGQMEEMKEAKRKEGKGMYKSRVLPRSTADELL
nr:hypothetical protein CFP56_71066 [Quercus suber]